MLGLDLVVWVCKEQTRKMEGAESAVFTGVKKMILTVSLIDKL